MRDWAKKLHQKLHKKILQLEEKWRTGQIFSRPLFFVVTAICFLVSIIAEGLLLDIVVPRLETRWALKAVIELLGGVVFILVFVLAARQKREKGFLFWYPWGMVIFLIIGILFLVTRQHETNVQYETTINDTNSYYSTLLQETNLFFSNSNSYLLGMISSDEKQIGQLNEQKHSNENQILNLKLDNNNINDQLNNALQRNAQLVAQSETAFLTYSNASDLIRMDSENPQYEILINGLSLTNYLIQNYYLVPLHKEREIILTVEKLKERERTVNNLTIDFSTTLDRTNMAVSTTPGFWSVLGGDFQLSGKQATVIETIDANSLTSVYGFQATPFTISTNFHSTFFPAVISIFAPGTRGVQSVTVNFAVPQ